MTASPTGPRTLQLEPAPGHRIVLDHLPGAAPPVVFLHGLTSIRAGEKSTALFDWAARRGQEVWRFDFRGHGESTATVAETSLTDLVDDALAVLEESGPAVLFGSSLGGLVAAWTAAKHPELVLGLTLLAPAFRFLPRLQARLDPRTGAVQLDRAPDAPEVRFDQAVFDDFARHDEDALPGRVTCPLQVFHGTLDDVVPVAASRDFVAAAASARKEFHELGDEDHRLNRPIAAILAGMARFHGLPEPR